MAVPEQTPYKEYTANGVTKIFPLEFDVLEQEHLIVLVNDLEPTVGSWSLDVQNDTVVFALPPANGANIKIRRDTPLERTTDFESYDNSFRPKPVNNDFDRIWWKLQELWLQITLLWASLNNKISALWLALSKETQARIKGDLDVQAWVQILLNNIVDNGLISAIAVTTVESIADLQSLISWDGRTVYVKSYYVGLNKGGSTRIYKHSRRNENDGFLCVNGWVLQIENHPNSYQAGAKGDELNDDTVPLQRLFNYSSPTEWQGGTTQSQSYFRKGNKVKVNKGCYRTTRPLLVGTGADIEFESTGSFLFSKYDGAVINPNFSNPLDFAIKSANYDANGKLCAYDKFVSGTEVDNFTYSSTLNIKIKNLQIVAESQIYGGLKLCAAAQSNIENFYIAHVDYGVALSSSWTTSLLGQSVHHKAGICQAADTHNLRFDGYFNRFNNEILPLSAGTNLIPTDLLNADKSVGVFLRGAQGAVSTQLTCEKNAIGLIAYFCPVTVSSFYSELNTEYTVLANASNVNIGTIIGYFDNRNFRILNNSTVEVTNYDAGNLVNFVPDIIEYADTKSRLIVNSGFHYFARNVIYRNFDKVIYVDPNTGNDIHTGFNKNYPCKSLSKALSIISSINSDGTMLYNKCTIVVNGGSHVINNTNLPNAELVVRSGSAVPTITFNSDSSFRLNNSKVEIVNCVVNVDKSYGWASYGGAGLNVLILRDCTTNLSNNACILYSNTDATTHFYLASSVVNGGAGECIAIIPNDSLATLELKCGASVSSAITSRSDKGLNLNRDNAIKIFPAAFR